jgi:hypothetical protein
VSPSASDTTTEDSQSDTDGNTTPVLRPSKRKVFSDEDDTPASPAKQVAVVPLARAVNGKSIPITDEIISDSSGDETPPKD